MAFKSIDDFDVSGFDDKLSVIEIAYLAKNFRNFLKNNNEGQEVKTMLNLEILGGIIPLRLITLKNLKIK